MSLSRLIKKNWKPTSENINSLPKPLKDFIHGIESLCDPAGIIRENIILRDIVVSLEKELKEKEVK